MYPEVGFTKGAVIDYYTRIAPVVLPHLRGPAADLKRYPDGVEGGYFYEKQCPSHRPDWVRTAPVEANGKTRSTSAWPTICRPLSGRSNLADLELHTSLSLAKSVERPTMMVFDLDPGAPAAIPRVRGGWVPAAGRSSMDLGPRRAFPKTSGSKGLQVYVPLNSPRVTYDHTKPPSRTRWRSSSKSGIPSWSFRR